MEPVKIITTPDLRLGPSVEKRVEPDKGGPSFGSFLKDSIGKVNQMQFEADDAVAKFAAGQETDIHKTMITMKKAEISFELLMQIRNKIVTAYEEIKRMQM